MKETGGTNGAGGRPALDVAGRRVLVMGAARSGIAAAGLLARRGARVTLNDRRPTLPEAAALRTAGIALALGGHPAALVEDADLLVLSPGIDWRHPLAEAARVRGVTVMGEIELAWRWLRGPVIAITGTKGKSTTTALTGRMLAAAGRRVLVGGNIGDPLSAQVEASTPDTLHVVEVSSFQLEQVSTFRPWIAALLNFSPDHLDRHGTVEAYGAAKAAIFARQTPADWAVVNADDPAAVAMAAGTAARQVRFSLGDALVEGTVVKGGAIVDRSAKGDEPLVPLSAVHLIGRHLVADVAAAATVARLAGAEAAAMTAATDAFRGLEHAMEVVDTVAGVRFVNDSKATNVESARRSIESVDTGLVPIMGGRFKGGDLRALRAPLAGRAHTVVAIGEARPLLREALGDLVAVRDAASMEEAVRIGFEAAGPGGTVVLAPACASFDMFTDYAERGRQFKEAVARLRSAVSRTRES